jgi:hypothetical protein
VDVAFPRERAIHRHHAPEAAGYRNLGSRYRADVEELPDVVAAFWRHHALASGDRRERLAAADQFWAWEAVSEAMQGDDALPLLDALLAFPEADPCALGAGPVEDLLAGNVARWDEPLAERCRRSERWRAVLACVWLDDAEQKRAKHLAAFLKQTP